MSLPKSEKALQQTKLVTGTNAIERLTALWALNEAGLGGIIHVFDTPFTGILMGGIASVLISLIAYFSNRQPSVLLKALMIVLIAKMVVSPQSGFPAYMAVSLQGVFGAYLFYWLGITRVSVLIMSFFALLESALQKIVSITFIYGNSFWKSIDIFLHQMFNSFGITVTNGSYWVIGVYLLIYIIAGIIFGFISFRLIKKLKRILEYNTYSYPVDDTFIALNNVNIKAKKNEKNNRFLTIFLTTFIIFFILTFFVSNSKNIQYGIFAVIRTVAFVILWYFIVNPLLMKWFKKYLQTKHNIYNRDVDNIFDFMNTLRKLIAIAWTESSAYSGIKRIKEFILRTFTYTLLYQPDSAIVNNN